VKHFFVRLLGVVFCFLFLVSAASAQITLCANTGTTQTLTCPAAPAAVQPGGVAYIAGTGFSGTITASNVHVTITPPAGNGSPVNVGAGVIACPPGACTAASSGRVVGFVIPSSLTTNAPMNCTVSLTATDSSNNVENSGNPPAALTINPPPAVISANPGAAPLGSTLTVTFTGTYTHFSSASQLKLTGPGAVNPTTTITQTGATIYNSADPYHVGASFTIPAGDPPGSYNAVIKSGTETVTGNGLFLVATGGPLSLSSITPNTLPAGQGTTVSVAGNNTHFVQGTTVASFGDGILPGQVTVTDSTHASFPITIDPIAVLGSRTLTMTTGGEFATGIFSITNNGSSLQSVSSVAPPGPVTPASFAQGSNGTVYLTGNLTHWVQAGTTVSFGGGINAGNIVVTSPTTLSVNLSVGPGVPAGSYPVTVTTNGEIVSKAGQITVTAATPYLSNTSPNSGTQGQQHELVTFTGVFTTFNDTTHGPLTANFGPNITVNSVVANTATSATADISIDTVAFTGGRSCTLGSDGVNYNFTFTVNPSSASLVSVTPNSGLQGFSVALQVTGSNTHWAQGLTSPGLGGITVNRTVINSPTSAEVDITIPANAGLGARSLTMSTNGEIVTLNNAFTVLPITPSMTLSPSTGMIAVAPATTNTVNVNLIGNFTHFNNGTTIAAIDGNGVTIQNFQVINQYNATAQFVINNNPGTAAPALPCTNIYGGNRTVTVETPLTSGAEIVYAGFCVTSTPAGIVSVTPNQSGEPATSLPITIIGTHTHFENGVTTVGFGPNITVGTVTVVNSTTLQTSITIASSAVLGWRPVFVNTVDAGNSVNEQLTAGFLITPPSSATLVSVLPNSGIQGQSLTVQLTGNLTNWAQGSTTALFGAGITVNNLTINSTASATAQISIDPVNSPLGASPVTMVTQLAGGATEVVTGPTFSVSQGIASINLVGTQCPNDATTVATGCQQHQFQVHQGDILTFQVIGSNTHWLQGETTLNFGSDIAVSNLAVVDPQTIICQIAVSYTATIGFRGVTAVTNAENAPSFSDALDVLAAQGINVNVTPTSAQQGTVFTMLVNGTNTHWTSTAGNPANNTTVTFGNNNGVSAIITSVDSATQMHVQVTVAGTAYAVPYGGLYTLTITTTGVTGPPQSTEQIVLNNILTVTPGAAIITKVSPTSGAQNTTQAISVTGQNTSFTTGVTTAAFSTGGCVPAIGAGINVSNVTATDSQHATLAIAVSATAPTGYQTLCMYTLGEIVSYSNAFQVLPGNPTLNGVSPVSGQQGQTLTNVALLGQFTHWQQGVTTVTFGQGVSVQNLSVTDNTHATATLVIDPTAYLGSRVATVTTGNEIVTGTYFTVTVSDAIIQTINPTSANQGQHILLQLNGQFTHWSQELTQFSIAGGGGDIRVNGVIINSPTQAIADLSISGTANLGTRSIYMSTVGENVSLQSGLLITGGIPSISSISPGSGTRGDVGDNIIITGVFTDKVPWSASSVVDFGDPCITVAPIGSPGGSTFNSQFSITAVVNIKNAAQGCAASLGLHTVTVRTGTSIQTGQFTVYDPAAPPTPYISYEYPSVALVGQTLAVTLNGAYTTWLTGQTTVNFGAGIQVNGPLDVTGTGSAVANITVQPGATVGPRTVTVTTGAQTLTTTFYVTVGTPAITLVSTNTAIQGETRLLDLVGQYTTWTASGPNPTVFQFCPGIDSVSNVQIFGPTAARVQVTVDQLAPTGYCAVTATTGAEVARLGGGGSFAITPSTAMISSVTPNTAIQGTVGLVVNVVGFATHWTNSTAFAFGSGVNITNIMVTGATTATLTLTLDQYATPGYRTLTATTSGEVASLNNAFVVQPGSPILLSASNGSNKQQAMFSIGLLGQYTSWTGANTTVTFPNGGVTGVNANVTSGQSITVTGTVLATAYTGCYPIVVTTTGQNPPVLTLYSAFCITPGPAAITNLNPNNLGQGQSTTVQITGTNTNWQQGVTTGTFGSGISVNSLTINGATSATASITVAANATPEANTVTLTTAGENASDLSAFTIYAATPVLLDVFPNTGTQGQTLDVCITGAFTHFVNGNTTADFGPGITVNSTTIAPTASCPTGDATHGDANITITPTALTNGTNHVRMITNLGGGSQEIAIWENSSATTMYNFAISPGGATITSAVPTTPATVHQNDVGDVIVVTGSGTHFMAGGLTPQVTFCTGVTTTGQTVNSNTQITVNVNVTQFAPTGNCGVTVTTGGEVASLQNAFQILGGLPTLSQVNGNSAMQGQTLNLTITGLYTHFTSGFTCAFCGNPNITVNTHTVNSDTSLSLNITIDPSAATGLTDATVQDATDGLITLHNGFTITSGTPTIVSVSPNTGAQGSTQTITITGSFTTWTAASVVTVSGGNDVQVGSGATVTNLANGYQQTIQVPFTVTNGAAATARTVYVTTGAQQLSLANAFTVLAGTPNVTQILPNIGVPGSTNLTVNITGTFTNWVNGTTTANFGAGIAVNGSAEGADGIIHVTGATTATATLTIDAAAALGARNVTVTTGAQVLTVNNGFTVQSTTTTAPTILYVSPGSSATNVPTNSSVTVVFSEPMNPATITNVNTVLADSTVASCDPGSGQSLPATVSLDASGRILTLTPGGLLSVGRTFYLTVNNSNVPGGTPIVSDQSANHLNYNQCYSFTAGFAADNTGPSFVSANFVNGIGNLPTNSKVILGFNKPINPATVSTGLTIMQGANTVPGSWGYSSDFTQAIFTPSPNLLALSPYTVAYTSAITDAVGNALTNPNTLTFTTGAAADTTGLSWVTYAPINGSTTGTNPVIRVVFNKAVNPLTVTPSTFYLYNNQNSATVYGSTITASPDNKTFTLTLAGNLLASTQYRFFMGTIYDWTGINSFGQYGPIFTTGTGADTTAPEIVTNSAIGVYGVSPAAGASGVQVNPTIYIHFTKMVNGTRVAALLDPTSLQQANVTLSPFVSGTVAFVSGDYSTITFTPSSLLAASTSYTINVAGFEDEDGNPMTPFAGSSFTTGSTATADTTHGTITATPTSGATLVPVNTNVVLQLNKPVDPVTVSSTSFRVYDNTSGVNVPGTIAISSNYLTLTFTQATQFQPGHQICIYASYYAYLYDLAGNTFNYINQCFTTGTGADTTAPTVVNVSPLTGATGIGPSNPVIVTFSKSINPGSLTSNVALYNGSTLVTAGYSPSSDYTTIVFNNGYLPFNTTFTVVVNPTITDLAGNQLGTQFSSTFTTGPAPVTSQPTVTAMRPGSGATGVSATDPITFFMSAPMNPATINSNSLKISQNGVLLAGTITPSADNQDFTFTPNGGSFALGAYIQVFFTSAATDTNGNPLYNFQSSFKIQPDLSTTAPTALSYNPCRYCGGNNETTVVEVLMNKPLNPSTVNSSTFYILQNNTTPVSGSIAVLDGGRLMRFRPGSPLSANTYYYVYITSGVQDTSGLSFAGSTSYQYYFYTSTTSNTTAPSVLATAPTNGATAIGTNALIGVTFSANVDGNTLDPSNVTLTGPGGNIPLTISYNASTFAMTLTPQAPLPPSATVTLTLNGVTDNDGNALSPTPYTLSFGTGPAPDYSVPILTQINVTNGQTGVPVNSSFSLLFNKPIDWRTVIYNNTILLRDNSASSATVPANITPIGANGILITPTAPLSVNHSEQILGCSIADLNGNVAGCYFVNISFTTVLTQPSGGPVVTQIIPQNGSGGVPVNFRPMVQFDRPVNPAALSGVTLTQSGNPITATAVLSSAGTVLTLVPAAILSPNTTYVFTVSGTQDSAGHVQSGPVTRSFTTGGGFDLTAPTATTVTPISNSTTGTNPFIQFKFSKPLNPINSASFSFYNVITNHGVNGAALNWAPDFKSVQFTYPGTLDPNSRYAWYLTFADLVGNTNSSAYEYFYTNTGTDSTGETVTSVTPPNAQGGVPLNATISLKLAKPASPATVNNSSVTLSPAVSGYAVQLSSDGMTITLAYTGNLAAGTTYTLTVPTGGFTDQDGNEVYCSTNLGATCAGGIAFSSTFTTGTSTDSTHGTISMINPSPGSNGAALTQAVTIQFSKPWNPNTLSGQYFVLLDNNNSNYPIAGIITTGNTVCNGVAITPAANTMTFCPSVALPANTTIQVLAGYYVNIYDLAGNNFAYLNTSFGTANTADTTPPQVVSITPANGATNVGPYGTVAITFNKSLDYTTINGYNFALYNGSTNLSAGVSYSSDRSIVYLSTTLPYSATITATVSSNVKDYNGNNLAACSPTCVTSSFTSTFTTETQPLTTTPTAIQVRPTGSGAALNTPITIYMNAPMSLPAVQNGMYVVENGALISGTVTLTQDQHGIIWTPAAPYLQGALIEVYLYPPAADISGNLATSYAYSFHTVSLPSSTTAPTETAYNPPRYTYTSLLNPVVEIAFSKALNPATVTSSSAFVKYNNTGSPISGTPVLLNGNALLRIPLTSTLLASGTSYYYVTLTSAIQDMSGNSFGGDNYYFYTTAASAVDNTPPSLSFITPTNGATGIGDNAPVRLVFSKLVDTLTIGPSTVTLMNGSTPLPYTATFTTFNGGTQTVAILMPFSPLPDSSTISVGLTAGINDLAGNTITAQTPTFMTLGGADFNGPAVTARSVDSGNNANVPVNSTFTITFSKPLDPASVTTGGFYLYDATTGTYPAVHLNVSADGLTVTIVPNATLPSGHSMDYYYQGATDLNGNALTNGSGQGFTTSSSSDTTPPSVVNTNPFNGVANVPTNANIEVIFNKAVRATSLGHITLSAGSTVPSTAVLENNIYTNDTVVRIIPQQLLLPNTSYTVTLGDGTSGYVQDVAGNTLAPGTSFQFTTGNNIQTQGLLLPTATVTTGSGTLTLPTSGTLGNVLDNPTFTFVFDHQVDYASLRGFSLRDTGNNLVTGVTLNFALSADQKTVTITTSGLNAATTYHLWIENGYYLYDSAGNVTYFGSQQYAFSTQ